MQVFTPDQAQEEEKYEQQMQRPAPSQKKDRKAAAKARRKRRLHEKIAKPYERTVRLIAIYRNVEGATVTDLYRMAPLYICASQQEAAIAIVNITFIASFDDYVAWCHRNDQKIDGVESASWYRYVQEVHGGIANLCNKFIVASISTDFGSLVSAFRTLKGSLCGLRLPSETDSEALAFAKHSCSGLADINRDSILSEPTLHLQDFADYSAKTAFLYSPDEAVRQVETMSNLARLLDDEEYVKFYQTVEERVKSFLSPK
jgi:hypothetical protein